MQNVFSVFRLDGQLAGLWVLLCVLSRPVKTDLQYACACICVIQCLCRCVWVCRKGTGCFIILVSYADRLSSSSLDVALFPPSIKYSAHTPLPFLSLTLNLYTWKAFTECWFSLRRSSESPEDVSNRNSFLIENKSNCWTSQRCKRKALLDIKQNSGYSFTYNTKSPSACKI